jgi:hypothetical protein
MPIEYAAYYHKREMVETLFSSTSPISTLPEWSIDGIIYHVKSFGLKPMVCVFFFAHFRVLSTFIIILMFRSSAFFPKTNITFLKFTPVSKQNMPIKIYFWCLPSLY